MTYRRALLALLAAGALAAPSAAYAQSFQRQGIFGCNINGAYAMSVGTISAIGGIYVPVNDAAVTLNTGMLVYKECVLRGVVDRMREAETASIGKLAVTTFNTSRNGNPQFIQNIRKDQVAERDRSVALQLTNGSLSSINPAFQGQVTRAVAKGYLSATRQNANRLTCPNDNIANELLGQTQSIWTALDSMTNPACNPMYAAVIATEQIRGTSDNAVTDMMTKLGWGQGVYDVYTVDENGDPITLTPGSIVRDNIVQILQSGYRQLENANDIDQMVSALFAGVSSQAAGDVRGLVGLTQSVGGKPSYMDQVVSEAQQGLRQGAANVALQILLAAKQIEGQYNSIMRQIADVLTQTINTLRDKERACWDIVISAVCTAPPSASGECTGTSGDALQVATSTAFSQAVIGAQIGPLASTTLQNISNSNRALTLIDQLIQGVSNTSDPAAQRLALSQLDSLVASRQLHTQSDLTQAQSSQTAVTTSMANLITTTVEAWSKAEDPNVGWCNINNPAVIQMWNDRWKK